MITKQFKFNVIPSPNGGSILVPGCEPSSTLTSVRMEYEIKKAGLCHGAIADVNDVLNAIPGSYLEAIPNSGYFGSRALLALPPIEQDCSCRQGEDYYAIIRGLGRDATEDESNVVLGKCDAFQSSNCDNRPEWRGQE